LIIKSTGLGWELIKRRVKLGKIKFIMFSGRFFRKGLAGQWKDVLTKNQIRAVVNAHYEQMSRFGYLPDA